jgi:hypothetical protein
MDDAKLKELRELVGQHAKFVYEVVKNGGIDELPHESQLYASNSGTHALETHPQCP